jgi:ABC-type bacteriocin/lantibiotic exporter with double-glycine peptidase domain
MIFSGFGVDIAESALREQCDCTPWFGTDALMAVDAAQRLGFTKTAKHTLTLAELQTLVAAGHYPIVFVDLNSLDGVEAIHALVVTAFAEESVTVLDPLVGERTLPLQSFTAAWALRHRLAILVEQ